MMWACATYGDELTLGGVQAWVLHVTTLRAPNSHAALSFRAARTSAISPPPHITLHAEAGAGPHDPYTQTGDGEGDPVGELVADGLPLGVEDREISRTCLLG